MDRFSLKRPGKKKEKILILLDDKNCGYVNLNDKNRYEIVFAVNYMNRSGFRFLALASPNFASEEEILTYLNTHTDQIIRAHDFQFFDELPEEEQNK